MRVEGVIFDYDGTLVHLNLDFDAMRKGVEGLFDSYGLDPAVFKDLHILEAVDKAVHLLSSKDPGGGRSFYERAMQLLTDHEVEAARKGRILPGAVETLRALRHLGIKVGIVTRNCDQAVRIAFPRIEDLCDAFVPRDDVDQVKPHPAHLGSALEKMGIEKPNRCLMVGDHVLDIEAGRRLGMKTAGVLTGRTRAEEFLEAGADLVLQDATQVVDRLRGGDRGGQKGFFQSGKLDIEILTRLLRRYTSTDERVVIGPQIGEDTAAIDMGDRLLVVTTDPITFATEEIGYYSVIVNANDIATSGAQPKWFTANVLLPEKKTTGDLVERIFRQIHRACKEFGISLIGGHTEITHGLDRPILIGHMMGEVRKEALVRTGGARVGDDVLLSKGICIEGTSIIAREKEEELLSMGVSKALIKRAKNFLYDPGISVIRDARLACEAGRVHSMHDVTEGGLANGLHEIAIAAKVGIVVERDRIPLFEESRIVCEAFDLDPLGLIASGALLLTASPGEAERIIEKASVQGVAIARIGRVYEGGPSVILVTEEGEKAVSYFWRDEVTKIFDKPS
ncbi:MAG: HAD-IA family hydrolase [Deltaproteobacteria bacterium]|nr:HAD-IA family hydrolase [Deltaproteobacteria bacterium]